MHSCEIQEKAVQFSLANLWIHEITSLWLADDMIAGSFPITLPFHTFPLLLGLKPHFYPWFI